MTRIKNEAKLMSTLKTDTGFDVICSTCLQYKTKIYCKPLTTLSKAKMNKYTIKFCYLLKNRSKGQYVCNLCLSDINKDKVPRRSRINKIKFASYPSSFIQDLKKSCIFQESAYRFENL